MNKLAKFFTVVTLILVILSLVSCKNRTTEQEKPSDDDVRFYAVIDQVLYCYDIQSGFCVAVCPDPLCKHDSENCLFYGVNSTNKPCNVGEKLYFPKFTEKQAMVCVYDERTGKVTTLFKAEVEDPHLQGSSLLYLGNIEEFRKAGDYIFFNMQTASSVEDEEDRTDLFDLFRLDLKNEQVKKLNKEPLVFTQRCVALSDTQDQILWHDNLTQKDYYTDLNYENRTEEDNNRTYELGRFRQETSEYTYKFAKGRELYVAMDGEKQPYYRFSLDFIATSKATGEETTICRDLSSSVAVTLPNDKILAVFNEEEPHYIAKELQADGNYRSVYNWSSQKLYMMNADGSERQCICELSGNRFFGNLTEAKKNMFSDPWIGIEINKYNVGEDGVLSSGQSTSLEKDIVLVNIESGEWKLTKSK